MLRVALRTCCLLVVSALLAGAAAAGDWTRYGYDAARSNSAPTSGLKASQISKLHRQIVKLDGTVDSSPVYVSGVTVKGKRHDLFVVTTTYGKTIAVDAVSGRILWRYVPPGIGGWQGSPQITTASPVADPAHGFVYSASPDGKIHKLALATGAEVRGGLWPVTITHDPTREKIASALNLSRGFVLATTGGYYGDAPVYQGHVVTIDASTGHFGAIFNSLCSNRQYLMLPRTCPASDSAIWARAGAVVEPNGDLLVATGNGPWDGKINWGDSVLELSPDAKVLLHSYTPANAKQLEQQDLDLGSTAPALLPGGLALQGGKDGVLRLLDLSQLPGPRLGGEIQTLRAPGGTDVFTTPAVLTQGKQTWVFVADGAGTAAYVLHGRKLRSAWENKAAGTSPIVAGGLVYVFDPNGGGLRVYKPQSGRAIATLAAGKGHWNSPIVADGRIALPEGNANDHALKGVLEIFR